ncbi:folate-dependent phosphoribosylglycinamide formyltransferase PurN [Neobacillus niacini]|nr:folate-dependent phosphoribosylglycinamide formyltransferase PurN [Neobacillus niacini]
MEVVLLVSDNPIALAVTKAKNASIPVFSFKAKDFPDKQAYELEVLEKLTNIHVEFIQPDGVLFFKGAANSLFYRLRF